MTLATRQQLRRGMNLAIALYQTLDTTEGPFALGRVGSHPCESHIGQIRAILRGQSRVRLWNRAEAAVSLMGEFVHDWYWKRPRDRAVSPPLACGRPSSTRFSTTAHDEATFAALLASADALCWSVQITSNERLFVWGSCSCGESMIKTHSRMIKT
jgi:hypothetical protein